MAVQTHKLIKKTHTTIQAQSLCSFLWGQTEKTDVRFVLCVVSSPSTDLQNRLLAVSSAGSWSDEKLVVSLTSRLAGDARQGKGVACAQVVAAFVALNLSTLYLNKLQLSHSDWARVSVGKKFHRDHCRCQGIVEGGDESFLNTG